MVKNIFVPGLTIGSEHLPYQPEKAYAYVEDRERGWRVYLRSAVFIHLAGQSFDPKKFLVVKKFGQAPTGKVWEPPKGQMEGKDTHGETDVMRLLEENVRREVEEEAKITELVNVHHTGLVYEAVEPDFPPNTYFQYHIFQAFVTPQTLQKAADIFKWLHAHPKAWARMRKDKREKDALGWYRGTATGLYGRWAPGIVRMYLAKYRNT